MKALIILLITLLTACAGTPEPFNTAEVTDTKLWAYNASQCPTLTNEIEFSYVLPDEAMVFMNVHRNADVQGITTLSSVEYSFWMRNAMACIDRDVNLVKYTDRYEQNLMAVEYQGWIAMRDERWVGHHRDRDFTTFHKIGSPNGEWREIE